MATQGSERSSDRPGTFAGQVWAPVGGPNNSRSRGSQQSQQAQNWSGTAQQNFPGAFLPTGPGGSGGSGGKGISGADRFSGSAAYTTLSPKGSHSHPAYTPKGSHSHSGNYTPSGGSGKSGNNSPSARGSPIASGNEESPSGTPSGSFRQRTNRKKPRPKGPKEAASRAQDSVPTSLIDRCSPSVFGVAPDIDSPSVSGNAGSPPVGGTSDENPAKFPAGAVRGDVSGEPGDRQQRPGDRQQPAQPAQAAQRLTTQAELGEVEAWVAEHFLSARATNDVEGLVIVNPLEKLIIF